MNSGIRRRSYLWGMVLLGFAAIALCATPSAFAKGPKVSKEKLKQEKKFIIKQIDLRQRNITFATWANTETTHSELLLFGETFITREQDEMAALKAWLLAWHGVNYTPTPKPVSEDLKTDLLNLDDDFEFAFDIEVLRKYRNLDQVENSLMKQERQKALHLELKSFVASTRMVNEAEMGYLKGWANTLEDLRDAGDTDDAGE